MSNQKITAGVLQEMKRRGEKIAALTSYDFFTTKMLDEAGIHVILVGDSLGNVVLGYENTLPVTMEDMLHHTRAVARARPHALLLGDMPYRTYESPEQALASARRFLEAGAEGVKLEGGEKILAQVRALVAAGIPVLGHIGLLPQSVLELGGYKVQGRTPAIVEQLQRDARALEAAGVFAVVMECVVAEVARQITASLTIPTIGIGSGRHCDGQILVTHDMLGQTERLTKHTKRYAPLGDDMRRAFANYRRDVESGEFPGPEHSFS